MQKLLLPCEPSARLTDGPPALPDVAPLQSAEDGRRQSRREQEEDARRKAWHAVYEWQGQRLQPYSHGREELWQLMCECDVPLEDSGGRIDLEAGQALKLLYLCATPAQDLARESLPKLVEAAEAWADVQVPRQLTGQAVDLARRIFGEARLTMARLKPAERRADSGNTAVPVWPASYLVMLAAALQGAMSPWDMEWEMPLARGRALIHGRWILDGAATLWMDRQASKTGAWLAEYRRRHVNRSRPSARQ